MDDDKGLLLQISQGSEQAMELFYRRHASAVYAFVYKTLYNEADASEILNETMLEVWKKAATFQGQSTVKTWLFSIGHHKAVDFIRRNKRHQHDSDDFIDEADSEFSCPLSEISIADENRQQVQHCIAQLKMPQREVVHLTFYSELSYPEIADILAIPAGTVKTRMLHAKKQLLTCIQRLNTALNHGPAY